MTGFSAALAFVLSPSIEGGRVDDPDDRGGRTAFGITQTLYDRWRRNRGLEARDVWHIKDDEVAAIYEGIWRDRKCERLPWPVSLVLFDMAVNHGAVNAVRILQRTVGAKDDGVHGPKTQAAIDAAVAQNGPVWVATKVLWQRLRFYYDIAGGTNIKFLRGWLMRVILLEEAAA